MRRRPRLLVLNPTCLDVIEQHRGWIERSGVELVADQAFRSLGIEALREVIRSADALVLPAAIRSEPSNEVMCSAPRLRMVSIAASGYEWFDLAAATRCGIVVANAPVREGAEAVADMTWALLLGLARQVPHFDRQVRQGDYTRGMGRGVWGKTLGIVGLGNIGSAVARRAAGFEMQVLAATRQPDREFTERYSVEVVALDELLRRSDFVTLHVRLDDTTRGMIGRRELELMKESAFLINTARAELVQEQAVTEALLAHRIAGYAQDDPPAVRDGPLLTLENFICTPHLGNRAIEGVHSVLQAAVDNVIGFLQDQRRPRHLLNPDVYATAEFARRNAG